MTIHLHDAELHALLLDADPVDVRELQDVARTPAALELRDAIVSNAYSTGLRSRRRRIAVLAAAAAAVITIPIAITLGHPSSGGSAYGKALVRFAENSPRLLVGADGWQVTRADEDDADTGEMTFEANGRRLDVFWVPDANGKETDKFDLTPAGSARIDGANAWVGYYPGSGADREFEAIWSVGDQAREARGTFPDKAAFLAVAGSLYRVDVDTWLDAMPASVVTPAGRAATVSSMLSDVPQPAGFDAQKLADSAQVLDRYQLGARVTGAVACAWLEQWAHGSASQRDAASAAMKTSHGWAILKEMQSGGAYPDVLWQIADAMNGKAITITKGETLEQWAKPGLGC